MKVLSKETTLEKSLIALFFLMGFIEVVSDDSYILYIIKPLEIVLLFALYSYSSIRKNPLFFINMLFLLIGRLLFIPNDKNMLFYALIAVFFHRIIEIYYVVKLVKIKDYIPPLLASIPFLIYFLYLVSIPDDILIRSYVVLVVQIILISVLSGIILSQYLLTFNRKDIWLFVFGIMSLMQTFVVFIEKFYLSDFKITSLRPMALFLNTIVCFSFYKFVITTERLNDN
ncbi:hypothetical protein AB3G33_13030 [Flavobacterium sp. WC2421]|jgi:hypothetical protein|uniref:YhhN-like protein n=3 Tax=unclassified Flavobacterium TaxID=196869 RepID=A0AB39W7Y9_9FLAO